jgi:hypothetical protein
VRTGRRSRTGRPGRRTGRVVEAVRPRAPSSRTASTTKQTVVPSVPGDEPAEGGADREHRPPGRAVQDARRREVLGVDEVRDRRGAGGLRERLGRRDDPDRHERDPRRSPPTDEHEQQRGDAGDGCSPRR